MVIRAGLIPETKFPQWAAVATYLNMAIVRRSCQIALIVGPTLLWINQGPLFILDSAVAHYKVSLTIGAHFIVSHVSGTAACFEASINRR